MRWAGAQRPVALGLLLGACIAGALGGVAGLVVGLAAYPPTAWAATFELGIPAAVLGGALGALVGAVAERRAARE